MRRKISLTTFLKRTLKYSSFMVIGFTALMVTAFVLPIGISDRSPEAERLSFQLADPNLEVTLIAAEPDVESPVAMSWGTKGELYVLEMPGYPTTTSTGRVKVLTDEDQDGRYTMKSIFAEGFDFPTGMMPYRDGLLIIDAPHLYFVRDIDNDGVAELKEVLITGFYEGNEQHRANALQWGLDNWIYGANGLSSGKIGFAKGKKRVGIDNRDFRFDISNQKVEAISGGSQYGLAMDNWGNRFISLNHRFARQVMLEERHLVRNPALSTKAVYDTSEDEDDRKVFLLLNDALRFNQDPVGYFTALSGVTAYKGHLLGSDYEGDVFAGESVQSAIIRRKMKAEGPSFTAVDMEEEAEFLASKDGWFHPVNFSNGPDGALYMVDFYRRFVEHPQWANEKLSEGIDWQEGQAHGRIWRIARKDKPLNPDQMQVRFDQKTAKELALSLGSPASWKRETAQQLIVDGMLTGAEGELNQMLNHKQSETRVQALWTLDGLKALEVYNIQEALMDEDPRVQVQAIKLAETRLEAVPELIKNLSLKVVSNNSLIRYHAILALGEIHSDLVQKRMIDAALRFSDDWTRIALLSSTSQWGNTFAKSYLSQSRFDETEEEIAFLGKIGEMVINASKETPSWVNQLAVSTDGIQTKELAFLNGFLTGCKSLGVPTPDISKHVFEKASYLAQHHKATSVSFLGVSILRFSSSPKFNKELTDLVVNSQEEGIRQAAILALSQKNLKDLSTDLFENIGSLSPSLRKVLISSSLASNAAAEALLNALESNVIEVSEISEELRYALLSNTKEFISNKADQILSTAINQDRQSVVNEYYTAIKNLPVNLQKGALLFQQNCSVCHAINGKGGIIAPDLTNIGSRSDQVLLVSILDPSRMVGYELKLHIIETDAGEIFSGTVASETALSYTIQEPGGKQHTILKENVKKHTSTSKSIMPEGFERTIDTEEMANLVAYLKNPSL